MTAGGGTRRSGGMWTTRKKTFVQSPTRIDPVVVGAGALELQRVRPKSFRIPGDSNSGDLPPSYDDDNNGKSGGNTDSAVAHRTINPLLQVVKPQKSGHLDRRASLDDQKATTSSSSKPPGAAAAGKNSLTGANPKTGEDDGFDLL